MKRTLLTCLILLAVSLGLFVSCNAETVVPDDGDGVAYIRFGEDSRRDLSASYTTEPYDKLYWFYKAVKDDDYGTMGQTTVEVPVVTTATSGQTVPAMGLTIAGDGLGPFSQGKWKFQLFAYKCTESHSTTDTCTYKADNRKLVYKSGDISTTLLGGETKVIPASVDPVGDEGTLTFGDAYFKYDSVQTRETAKAPFIKMVLTETSDATKTYTITNDDAITGGIKIDATCLDGNKTYTETISTNPDTTKSYTRYKIELSSSDKTTPIDIGTYRCDVVVYLKDNGKAITDENTRIYGQTFYFGVYGSATTTIGGDILEKANSHVKFDVAERVIMTAMVQNSKVTFNASTTSDDDSAKKLSNTKVDLDLSSLSDASDIKSVSLETETLVGEKAAEGFTVVDKTNAKEVVLLSLNFTAKDQTGKEIGTVSDGGFGKAQTIEKYIGIINDLTTETAKTRLGIFYNGAEDTNNIKITGYDSTTGMLTFTTTHFSTFVLVDKSKFPASITKNGKTEYYETLEKAFAAAAEGDTIKVNSSASTAISSDIVVDKSVILDFNSKTVTAKNGASISVKGDGVVLTVKNAADGQTEIIKGFEVSSAEGVNGKYYSSSAGALASTEGSYITFMDNVVLTEKLSLSKNVTLDLNGNTLKITVASGDAVDITAGTSSAVHTVTIKDGNIVGSTNNCNFFAVNSYATLTLDGVTMNVVAKRGIQIKDYEQSATVNVTGSTLNVKDGSKGVYVIATNASVKDKNTSNGITINITGSTLNASSVAGDDCGSTALLLNVPGNYTITDSVIKGERQAAVFRGGTYTVSGSTFEYTTNHTHNSSCERNGWDTGNDVPNAAIVIGNKTKPEYAYKTEVTFSGDKNTLKYPTDGRSLYIYQADKVTGDDETVNRSVTVNGYNESWTVNDDFNGATVKSTDGKTWYVADEKSLRGAIKIVGEDNTIKLLSDIEPANGIGIYNGEKITIDLNGKNISFTTNGFVIGVFAQNGAYNGKGGSLKITGKGKVNYAGGYAIQIAGNYNWSTEEKTSVYIDEDVELEGIGIFGVVQSNFCYDVNIDVYGTLTGNQPVYVNGAIVNRDASSLAIVNPERVPVITIYDGAKVQGLAGMNIAGYAKVVIKKAEIEGRSNAIAMCAGKLEINGATIIAGTTRSDDVEGTGGAITSNQCSAVYVKQQSTNNYVEVVINSGEFSGYIPFRQDTGDKADSDAIKKKVSIAIKGGTFTATGTEEGSVSVQSADKTGFITGGKFSTDPSSYVASGYKATPSGSVWTVGSGN